LYNLRAKLVIIPFTPLNLDYIRYHFKKTN